VFSGVQAQGTPTQVAQFRYGSFGELLFSYGSGEMCTETNCLMPYRYTGQRFDPETGLYYYKNRYYIPEAGRFVTRDPSGYVDGSNMYAYSTNSPASLSDPLGLNSVFGFDGNLRDKRIYDFDGNRMSRVGSGAYDSAMIQAHGMKSGWGALRSALDFNCTADAATQSSMFFSDHSPNASGSTSSGKPSTSTVKPPVVVIFYGGNNNPNNEATRGGTRDDTELDTLGDNLSREGHKVLEFQTGDNVANYKADSGTLDSAKMDVVEKSVRETMKAEGTTAVCIIGFSLGSNPAIDLANRLHDNVQSLHLVDPQTELHQSVVNHDIASRTFTYLAGGLQGLADRFKQDAASSLGRTDSWPFTSRVFDSQTRQEIPPKRVLYRVSHYDMDTMTPGALYWVERSISQGM